MELLIHHKLMKDVTYDQIKKMIIDVQLGVKEEVAAHGVWISARMAAWQWEVANVPGSVATTTAMLLSGCPGRYHCDGAAHVFVGGE